MQDNNPQTTGGPIPEAKTCPFCGHYRIYENINVLDEHFANCGKCGAQGPDWGENREEAIAAWNDLEIEDNRKLCSEVWV